MKAAMEQVRTNPMQAFPVPANGGIVEETPPCLSWIPLDAHCEYTVKIYRSGELVSEGSTEKNYFVPKEFLAPGMYTWTVETENAVREPWSFSIAEHAVTILRKSAEEVFAAIPDVRPRHLFFREDIPELITRTGEIEALKRTVEAARHDGMPQPPRYHMDENALPYREYFGRYRDFCDRDLIACGLAWQLLGDKQAAKHGKELLLTICSWNPEGPCSITGKWGDEVGLSNARCLPAALDLFWDLLDGKQREFVAKAVVSYALQCEARLGIFDYCRNPGDSHAGRLPAYLGEAAMVLKGTNAVPEETLLRWLGYALEIYGGIFPHFGGTDGGWAEGVFYATSYTRWYLPFFTAVERYSGVNYLSRPFYQRLCQYYLHFAADAEVHPFGDGYWCHSEDAEWPGFFAQNPCRIYAQRFGPKEAVSRAEKAASPEVFLLHLLDVFLPRLPAPETSLAGPAENLRAFPDTGFVSMHTNVADPENDTWCLMRASRFGSDSHRHADQGSFALLDRGTALITPSGYFGRQYGTKHHFRWLKTTQAHNALLFNGIGQYENSHLAAAKLTDWKDEKGIMTASADMTGAYPLPVKWLRELSMTKDGLLTVTDTVDADIPVTVSYPLHFLSLPEAQENSLKLLRNGTELTVTPLEGGLSALEITDKFAVDLNEGEPEAYHVTMPQQYHAMWKTAADTHHRIVVEYRVRRLK